MNSFEKIANGLCPNDCGEITILEKPVSILLLLPEDICSLSELEGTETPMDMFGHIRAICAKCGFVASTSPAWEFDYDSHKWRRSSETEPSK